ncbi:MarR family winged helix-turn-helix transcriptional regulator [Corynebacterium variabile]|uniref:MarR family winged helix-turn-helix transcriptional regulator n=1 Tax=Corynebacterium variabile TaxID=1727 RepID=UPI001DD4D85E|nr:MarR family transcriptional regulator [Corynebacterium variabile]HJG46007.1 MarR family transcriptional regulator [Corynebacterium variabile]
MSHNDEEPSNASTELAQQMRDSIRTAVQMTRLLEYPGDLSTPQVSVLNTLSSEPVRIGDLAALGGVTQPGMSQLVSRLEGAGLVERTRSDEDARVTLVEITDEGRNALDRVNRERNRVLGVHLERLSDEEVRRIRDGLSPLSSLAQDVVRDLTAGDDNRRR